MKTKILLLGLVLCLASFTAQAYDLYIEKEGMTYSGAICPGSVETYILRSDLSTSDPHTDIYHISITNGVIISVDDETLPSDTTFVERVVHRPLESGRVKIKVKWNNNSGIIGKISFDYYTSIWYVQDKSKSKDVIIGLGFIEPIKINRYSPSCEWNEITFSVDPVLGATSYQWSNSLGWTVKSISTDKRTITFNATSSITTGTVTVTASTAGCTDLYKSRSYEVTRTASVATIIGPDVVPAGGQDAFSTGLGTNYIWTVPSGWTVQQSQYYINSVHIIAPQYNSPGGNLTVSYIDPCGVAKTATKFISTEVYENNNVGNRPSTEIVKEENIETQIYPNPTSRKVIVLPKDNSIINIRILNSLGAVVYEKNNIQGKTELDIKELSSGIYFIEYMNEDKREVVKLIKN